MEAEAQNAFVPGIVFCSNRATEVLELQRRRLWWNDIKDVQDEGQLEENWSFLQAWPGYVPDEERRS